MKMLIYASKKFFFSSSNRLFFPFSKLYQGALLLWNPTNLLQIGANGVCRTYVVADLHEDICVQLASRLLHINAFLKMKSKDTMDEKYIFFFSFIFLAFFFYFPFILLAFFFSIHSWIFFSSFSSFEIWTILTTSSSEKRTKLFIFH